VVIVLADDDDAGIGTSARCSQQIGQRAGQSKLLVNVDGFEYSESSVGRTQNSYQRPPFPASIESCTMTLLSDACYIRCL
jgi:hypothetical protein